MTASKNTMDGKRTKEERIFVEFSLNKKERGFVKKIVFFHLKHKRQTDGKTMYRLDAHWSAVYRT